MTFSDEVCRHHLQFMKWADETMLAAVAEKMPDRISILQHIYLAERVWLERLQGNQNIQLQGIEAPSTVSDLQNRSRHRLHNSWLGWAADVTDWETIVLYRNSQGTEFRMPVWQIVMHVVNHGSYHRGQVAANLRQADITPPNTDLMTWFRKLL